MFLSSPTYAAPDTTIDLATGWFDIHHAIPTESESRLGNPNQNTSPYPCYAFHPNEPVTFCRLTGSVTSITASTRKITNYPPPYYWILGAAELAMSPIRVSLEGDAARAIGLLACISLLAVAARRLYRARERNAIWSIYLLTPPIAAFLFAGANPNGWEIACALFFTATLLYRRVAILSGSLTGREALSIALAGLLLTTARPTGGAWLALIAATYVVWFRIWRIRRSLYLLATAILPGIVFTLVWNSVFAINAKVGPTTSLTIDSFISQLSASWQDISEKFVELWGVLGWLDTNPSGIVVVGVALVLLYFLPTYAPTRAHQIYLVAIIALIFVVSSIIEAAGWNIVGNSQVHSWWQGRYSLPALAGLSMLLFSDPERRERPGMFALAAWVTVGNAYMICLNFWRYDYGIRNGFPVQIANGAHGPVYSIVVYLIVLVLLGTSAILFSAGRAQREAGVTEPTLALSSSRWP